MMCVILGHADLTTTRRYSHLAPTEHLDVVETIVVKKDDGAREEKPDSAAATCTKVATEVATEPLKLKIVGSEQ